MFRTSFGIKMNAVPRRIPHALCHSEFRERCTFAVFHASPNGAGEFPTLRADQSLTTLKGLLSLACREAAFLYRSGVSCIPFSGVQDIVSMQWRNYRDMMCVCDPTMLPTLGSSEVDRVGFWHELIVVARHVRSTKDLPLLIAGDANVWRPEFSLGRSRSQDDLIVPFDGFVGLFMWARADQSARSGNT